MASPSTASASAQSPAPTLPPGKPFTVAFDGALLTGTIAIRSVRDIDRLMRVLQAQKAAFEAMADDEPDPDLAYDSWAEARDEQEADEQTKPGH